MRPKNSLFLGACLAASLTAIGLLLPAGCGSHGEAPKHETPTAVGRAVFSLHWPERTRLIPRASNSISVRLMRGNSILASGLLSRPAAGGDASVSFDQLPVGDAVVAATAYPNTDGTGVPQAVTQVPITIVAGQVTPVQATLASTIASVDILPLSNHWVVGQGTSLLATARDASGAVVLIRADTLQWKSLHPDIATVDPDGTVHPLAAGNAEIQVTETESGKSATISLGITAPPTPAPSPTPTPRPNPDFYVILRKEGVPDQYLYAIRATGEIIWKQAIPQNPGAQPGVQNASSAGDLVVDKEGNLLIANDSCFNSFSRYNVTTGVWEFHWIPPVFYPSGDYDNGGIDVQDDYVYLTQNFLNVTPDPLIGLIRLNLKTGEVIHFVADTRYEKVTVGQDGFLYAVVSDWQSNFTPTPIHVFDLTTLQRVRTIQLPVNVRDIAVDRNGRLFGTQNFNGYGQYQTRLIRFSPDGVIQKALDLPGRTMDINLASDGRIVASGEDQGGSLYLTDTSLNAFTTVSIEFMFPGTVTFAAYRP